MNYGPRAARAARAARYFIKYSLMRVFLRGGAKQRAGRAGVPGYIHLQSGLPLTKQHIYNRLFSFQKNNIHICYKYYDERRNFKDEFQGGQIFD